MSILDKRNLLLCAIRFGIALPVSFAAIQYKEFVSKWYSVKYGVVTNI